MSNARHRAARRRQFIAVVALLALGGVAALAWPRGGDVPSAGASPAGDQSPSAEATIEPVPTWLAWISGGFPAGFRADAADLEGFEHVVVVAGDTQWLTASRGAGGAVVDRPPPPYRIPIDAFAVDAGAYAPFLPEGDVRDTVVDALRAGQGILGETSAELRQLGPGGSLSFGDLTIEVGAVVPDALVGWSELLVARKVGVKLGIVHDRYLLATGGPDGLTERSVTAQIAALLPVDTAIRVDAPSTTPYVRVASGVNPPVLMKTFFGEFAAQPNPSDPAFLTIEPAWVERNIRTRDVPLLGAVTCHRRLFPPLLGALRDLQSEGLGGLVKVYSGCWAARTIARSPTAPPSNHAYGAAIDINAPQNPYGQPPTMDRRMVEIFERWGFTWGGGFLVPDGHHFEFREPAAA